jgi:hypothetical protein
MKFAQAGWEKKVMREVLAGEISYALRRLPALPWHLAKVKQAACCNYEMNTHA